MIIADKCISCFQPKRFFSSTCCWLNRVSSAGQKALVDRKWCGMVLIVMCENAEQHVCNAEAAGWKCSLIIRLQIKGAFKQQPYTVYLKSLFFCGFNCMLYLRSVTTDIKGVGYQDTAPCHPWPPARAPDATSFPHRDMLRVKVDQVARITGNRNNRVNSSWMVKQKKLHNVFLWCILSQYSKKIQIIWKHAVKMNIWMII